jgi:predicted nuclease of restriction endonuclease-like (RecB) superfamily
MDELENENRLIGQVSTLIESANTFVHKAINQSMVLLYWQIGKTIQDELLQYDKPEYGKQVMQNLAIKLSEQYGKGYSYRTLYRMTHFYDCVQDQNILTTVLSKLSWSHILEILKIKEPLKQEFYISMCSSENWSVRELSGRIDSMLFERTAISKLPEKTIANDLKQLREKKEMSVNLFVKDPYVLDFLGLKDTFSEYDLELAILVELQQFILEFGNDFAFLARQKRITIDQEDYFIDKYEKQEGENTPIGLLLCSEKSDKMVELLELDKSGIHVATYLTELPPVAVFESKIQQSIALAKQKWSNTPNNNE